MYKGQHLAAKQPFSVFDLKPEDITTICAYSQTNPEFKPTLSQVATHWKTQELIGRINTFVYLKLAAIAEQSLY